MSKRKTKLYLKAIITGLILISAIIGGFIYYKFALSQLKEFHIYKNNSNGYLEVNFIDSSTVSCIDFDRGMNMDYCYSHFYSSYELDKVYSKNINTDWLNVYCYKISDLTWGCGNYITKGYYSNLDYSGTIVEFPLCINDKCYAYIITYGVLK